MDITPLTRYESMNYMEHNHYIITGRTSSKIGRGYTTVRYAVVCKDIIRAIALCSKDHPEFIIQSIAHQGQIERVEV